ncbi:MAG: DUF2513 domain-containing protein [Anaerocolumna sp.]
MKLNLDCVRDILLTIEDYEYRMNLLVNEFCIMLPDYSPTEVIYCCEKLYEGNYLNLDYVELPKQRNPELVKIRDITFQGHEFLANIRSDANWKEVKGVCGKIGSIAFSAIKSVAEGVTISAVNNYFGFK